MLTRKILEDTFESFLGRQVLIKSVVIEDDGEENFSTLEGYLTNYAIFSFTLPVLDAIEYFQPNITLLEGNTEYDYALGVIDSTFNYHKTWNKVHIFNPKNKDEYLDISRT